MVPLVNHVEQLIEKGAPDQGQMSCKCRRSIKHHKHLRTFVYGQSLDATNNFAERIFCQGVLWRKSGFGTQSERAGRYVCRRGLAGRRQI